jgi:linoleoyl-CoA desaturase
VLPSNVGIIIALVFQLAHIVEASKFTKSFDGEMSHSWEEQQLFETINFQTNSKILRFYVGGLNHQIEHHLFPNISHVHYHMIQPIVEKTCKEFELPYVNLSLSEAKKSHFQKLKQLSKRST